ncbi:MbcA/ParS/Xre antitoxin family protein [Mesorhizobium sp. Cs1299R1N3]|uniref:MbcA/ParS/Xre antitoxin family protein n=1 Tax=Mesorhizobium sp. Cs1299R1N3 TaxID=3015173 RepID=UPI00301DDCCE
MAGHAQDVSIEQGVQERTALGTFINIADAWGLTTDQQIILLGSPARSTFFKWKKEGGAIPSDTLERISHVFSIYKCLNILFPDPQRADQWIKRENKYWHGRSALGHMMKGRMADLIDVRRYLDAQRGG